MTATGTVVIPDFGEEQVTFTGYMLTQRGDPYCDAEGRFRFDWHTIERDLTAETSLGTVTIIQAPDQLDMFSAISPIAYHWTEHPCYAGGAAAETGCYAVVGSGLDPILAVPDPYALMQADDDVIDTPPVYAHFSLVEPVDYVTPVSRELVFTLQTLTLDTGPLTRGACRYDAKHCFVVPEYSCFHGGGSYQGDGTRCSGEPIPTVSEWGLVVLTLLLLAGGKIIYGRWRSQMAV